MRNTALRGERLESGGGYSASAPSSYSLLLQPGGSTSWCDCRNDESDGIECVAAEALASDEPCRLKALLLLLLPLLLPPDKLALRLVERALLWLLLLELPELLLLSLPSVFSALARHTRAHDATAISCHCIPSMPRLARPYRLSHRCRAYVS